MAQIFWNAGVAPADTYVAIVRNGNTTLSAEAVPGGASSLTVNWMEQAPTAGWYYEIYVGQQSGSAVDVYGTAQAVHLW
jgi:hypothetical protein